MKYLQKSGYKENDLIPVFEQNNGARTYRLSDILNIVVDKMNTEGKVCSKVPINVEHSCTFVVDSSKLGLLNDVRAEDCVSWCNNGVRPCVVSWKSKKVAVIACGSRVKTQPRQKGCYLVERSYFVHKSHDDFRKIITMVYGKPEKTWCLL